MYTRNQIYAAISPDTLTISREVIGPQCTQGIQIYAAISPDTGKVGLMRGDCREGTSSLRTRNAGNPSVTRAYLIPSKSNWFNTNTMAIPFHSVRVYVGQLNCR